MNKIIISGRLTADATVKETESTTVAKFCVAVDGKKDKDGNRQTDFINCVAFGEAAKRVLRASGKGLRIIVNGSLNSRKYATKDAQNAIAWEVLVEYLEIIDWKEEKVEELKEIEQEDLPF